MTTDENTITAEELADKLHTSSSTIRRRCRDDGWPHLRMKWKGTSRYLFTPEHVELILSSMQQAPVIELRRPRRAAPAPTPARRKRARS